MTGGVTGSELYRGIVDQAFFQAFDNDGSFAAEDLAHAEHRHLSVLPDQGRSLNLETQIEQLLAHSQR